MVEKEKRRSSWMVDESLYSKMQAQAKDSNVSVLRYLTNICEDIASGHYDHLVTPKEKDTKRSISVYQVTLQKALTHIKKLNDKASIAPLLAEIVELIDEEGYRNEAD